VLLESGKRGVAILVERGVDLLFDGGPASERRRIYRFTAFSGDEKIARRVRRGVSFANKQMAWKSLSCNTFITMVKTAQLGNCDYATGALHLSRKRGLLIQSQVGAGLMVIIEVPR
jgi:hypothetical protein